MELPQLVQSASSSPPLLISLSPPSTFPLPVKWPITQRRRIPRAATSPLHGRELTHRPVKSVGLFDVDGMAAFGDNQQSSRGNHAFHEDAWLQAAVLVPSRNRAWGSVSARSCSSNSYTEGRRPCTPLHGARRADLGGAQPGLVGVFPPASGSLSSNWTRVGPFTRYTAATARIPSRSKNVRPRSRSPAGNAGVRLPRNRSHSQPPRGSVPGWGSAARSAERHSLPIR